VGGYHLEPGGREGGREGRTDQRTLLPTTLAFARENKGGREGRRRRATTKTTTTTTSTRTYLKMFLNKYAFFFPVRVEERANSSRGEEGDYREGRSSKKKKEGKNINEGKIEQKTTQKKGI